MGEEPIAAGTVLDDKFRILRRLGRGGMGEVYAVRHELTQHARALKLLHAEWREHEEVVGRFLREASAAGRIDHPHICETYDAGFLSTGEPYVLMELLEGRSLEEWLSQEHTLPVPVAADLVAQACRGIQAAHDAGIIHRDLKPENLLVVEKNGQPFVKLLDFGISKFEDALNTSRATQDGALLGTPYYMSPEQFADGHDVDGRADVYSLGVILYECLTGRPPFVVDTLAQLAKKVMLDDPAPPSSLQVSLPDVVDAVVMRALDKDPDHRFPTASAMAQELEQLTRKFGVTFPQGGRAWEPPEEAPPADAEAEPSSVRIPAGGLAVDLSGETVLDAHVPLAIPTSAPPTLASSTPQGRRAWVILAGLLVAVTTAGVVVWLASLRSPQPSPVAPSSTPVVAVTSPPATAPPTRTLDVTARPTASSAAPATPATPAAPLRSSPPAISPPPPPRTKPEHATADEFPD